MLNVFVIQSLSSTLHRVTVEAESIFLLKFQPIQEGYSIIHFLRNSSAQFTPATRTVTTRIKLILKSMFCLTFLFEHNPNVTKCSTLSRLHLNRSLESLMITITCLNQVYLQCTSDYISL